MQTFLPYPDFASSARALDNVRLGKQRVETMQILRALTRSTYGWKHHPAVRMWQGFEEALGAYGMAICAEWTSRGFSDSCQMKMCEDLRSAGVRVPPRSQRALARARSLPPWLGDEGLHRSHRSSLLSKEPSWYGAQFGDEPRDLPYVWPTQRSVDA